jgi:hypothetical protein
LRLKYHHEEDVEEDNNEDFGDDVVLTEL